MQSLKGKYGILSKASYLHLYLSKTLGDLNSDISKKIQNKLLIEKVLCSITLYLVDEAQVYVLEKISFHLSVHC